MMFYQYYFAVKQLKKWYSRAKEELSLSSTKEEWIKRRCVLESVLSTRVREIEENFPNRKYDNYTSLLISGNTRRTIKETYNMLCGEAV